VLLTDFGDWHSVLNRWLHVPPLPGESTDDWCAHGSSLTEWPRDKPVSTSL